MIGNVVLFIVGGIGAVSALFLPIICGTLNPVQIAVNLGLVEGEVSNLRKFKRNGEPMDHGVKFGHKWYDTDAVRAGLSQILTLFQAPLVTIYGVLRATQADCLPIRD